MPGTLNDAIADLVRAEVARQLAELRPAAPAEYLGTTAAAKRAKVHPGTLRRWIKDGRLPAHYAGRVLRVRVDQLDALLRGEGPNSDDANETPEQRALRLF